MRRIGKARKRVKRGRKRRREKERASEEVDKDDKERHVGKIFNREA
jgi:hypothetical protein